MVRKSALAAPSFSLLPPRLTACSRCWSPYSLYRLETIEKAMPVNHKRAARCWIAAKVAGANGRTLAEWSCRNGLVPWFRSDFSVRDEMTWRSPRRGCR